MRFPIGFLFCCSLFFYRSAFGQSCETNRLLLQEGRDHFRLAPKFKLGNDSLLLLINRQLDGKLLSKKEISPDTIVVVFEVDRSGSISKIEPIAENDISQVIIGSFNFLKSIKEGWCPGYIYYKSTRKRKTNISHLDLILYTVDGVFQSVKFLR